jgi:exonuclease VII large subunit
MALEKMRNIEKLRSEGVFDNNKLQVMPLLPGRMAVISVETSKGYHDFLNILHQHASQYHGGIIFSLPFCRVIRLPKELCRSCE